MKSFAVLVFVGLQCVWGQSISSCGQAGDHLSNVQMSITPDPIKRGKQFSISLGGDLDEDISAGTVAIDLTVSAFGQGSTTTESVEFKLSDGLLKKGSGMKIDVGPLKLPSLPGSAVVNGTVKVTNDKGEGIACVKLDLKAPLLGEAELEPTLDEKLQDMPSGLSICSKSTDHIKNLKIDKAADTSVTITGTFDEAIDTFNVNVALKLKIGPIPYNVKVPVPVKLTNLASPIDDFSIYVSAPKDRKLTTHGNLGEIISATGEITATDGNGEEILCLDIGNVSRPSTMVV